MSTTLNQLLCQIKVGGKQRFKNMTLYCLLCAEETPAKFLTLDEALARGDLLVSEVSEGGSVPELRVVNKSLDNVLLMDGEELVGAKQNRVLNVTILLGPSSNTIIPVSCVERGRWAYRTKHFGSASRAMSAQLRKSKVQTVTANLRREDRFRSDQGDVWREIEDKYARMGERPSPTGAMGDLYESFRDRASDYMKAFQAVDNQIGMIVFIDRMLAGVELFNKFDQFKLVHAKLINSYVMDALETSESGHSHRTQSLKSKALKFLEDAQKAKIEHRRSVGLGNDVRMESETVLGAGLEYEGQVIQATIFPVDDVEYSNNQGSIIKASRRRRAMIR
jgi:hypothetical protein